MANQKTCYRLALDAGADIVVMIHPDYQYTPLLLPAMVSMIANGLHPCVLGSRILGGYSLKGGMPVWKYVANRWLTFVENVMIGAKLSEYHTGYRAFSREILEKLDLSANSDDFVFDNEMLAQIVWHGFSIGEVSCPTKYFAEASSINFSRSVKYGFGCLSTGLRFRLQQAGTDEVPAVLPGKVTERGRSLARSVPPTSRRQIILPLVRFYRAATGDRSRSGKSKRARRARPFFKLNFDLFLLRAVERERQTGLLAVRRGAGDDAGLDGLINGPTRRRARTWQLRLSCRP